MGSHYGPPGREVVGIWRRRADRAMAQIPRHRQEPDPPAGGLSRRIVEALAVGPLPAWGVAERLGVSVARVMPLLRALRARGRVVVEVGPGGVRCWQLATSGPPPAGDR